MISAESCPFDLEPLVIELCELDHVKKQLEINRDTSRLMHDQLAIKVESVSLKCCYGFFMSVRVPSLF